MNAGNSDLVLIKENTFQSAKALLKLDLSFNKFRDWFEGNFDGAVVLEELDLSNNEIRDVKSFKSLKSLEKINLSKNNISILKKSYFLNVGRLQEINLSFNKLTYIEEGSFEKLTFLENLNISHNFLSEFSENIRLLHILDIRTNKLTTLTIGSYLQRLYAQENQISNLKIAPNYSNQLTFLNISNNKLENFSNMSYLHSLITLDVTLNKFKDEITAEALNKLISLQYLYLEGNNIEKFQYSDLQLRYLKEISLSTINFDCGVLRSMIKYLNDKKIKFNGNLADCGQIIPSTVTPNVGPTSKPSDDRFETLNKKYEELTLRVESLERNIGLRIILGLSATAILLYTGYRFYKFYTLRLRYRNHQPLSDTLTETFDVSLHPL